MILLLGKTGLLRVEGFAMLKNEHERAICGFVREILTARTGELVELTDSPEDTHRSGKVVEERWHSASAYYAAEHTRIESFEGQIENERRTDLMLTPVRRVLEGNLPGTFVLAYQISDLAHARMKFKTAEIEVCKEVLTVAFAMAVGETRRLEGSALPCPFTLHRRHEKGSQIFLYCLIPGESEALRLERIKRALAAKLPKLRLWATDNRTSVLILEANDIQHANSSLVLSALNAALPERHDQPDLVVLVETDGGPWYGWVLKDGDRIGDEVPTPNGGYCYTQGAIAQRFVA